MHTGNDSSDLEGWLKGFSGLSTPSYLHPPQNREELVKLFSRAQACLIQSWSAKVTVVLDQDGSSWMTAMWDYLSYVSGLHYGHDLQKLFLEASDQKDSIFPSVTDIQAYSVPASVMLSNVGVLDHERLPDGKCDFLSSSWGNSNDDGWLGTSLCGSSEVASVSHGASGTEEMDDYKDRPAGPILCRTTVKRVVVEILYTSTDARNHIGEVRGALILLTVYAALP